MQFATPSGSRCGIPPLPAFFLTYNNQNLRGNSSPKPLLSDGRVIALTALPPITPPTMTSNNLSLSIIARAEWLLAIGFPAETHRLMERVPATGRDSPAFRALEINLMTAARNWSAGMPLCSRVKRGDAIKLRRAAARHMQAFALTSCAASAFHPLDYARGIWPEGNIDLLSLGVEPILPSAGGGETLTKVPMPPSPRPFHVLTWLPAKRPVKPFLPSFFQSNAQQPRRSSLWLSTWLQAFNPAPFAGKAQRYAIRLIHALRTLTKSPWVARAPQVSQ